MADNIPTLPTITVTAPRHKSGPATSKYGGLVTADDYYIEDIRLVTPTNTLDIRGMVAEISYYEDIFRGSVTGHILIADSVSLIERLSLSGSDFLYLSFRKTRNVNTDNSKVEKYFRVYRASERHLTNQETKTMHYIFVRKNCFFQNK